MGITHAAILGGLYPKRFKYQIVEPNKKIRQLLTKSLGYECFASISDVNLHQARVLVTTPPNSHASIVRECIKNGAKNIFVEKPFGTFDNKVETDPRIKVGYVLRFSEVAQTLKKIILEEGCKEILLDYSSNTITSTPKGWRNSIHGGVLNEMGSHLVDLILYLLDNNHIIIDNKHYESVISNVDDIFNFSGKCGTITVGLTLNWVNKEFRKPVWSGKLVTNKRTITFDQQSISSGFEPISVDYYVRGREFSLQMKHFVENDSTIFCDSYQANCVHDVILILKQK